MLLVNCTLLYRNKQVVSSLPSQILTILIPCINTPWSTISISSLNVIIYVFISNIAIIKAEVSDNLDTRLDNLKSFFLLSLYKNICRSLFEKDKLLFSFLLAIRLMEFRNELDQEAYRFLLTGGLSLKETLPDHPSTKLKGDINTSWLSSRSWGEVSRLSDLTNFPKFYENFYNVETFNALKVIYDSLAPQE